MALLVPRSCAHDSRPFLFVAISRAGVSWMVGLVSCGNANTPVPLSSSFASLLYCSWFGAFAGFSSDMSDSRSAETHGGARFLMASLWESCESGCVVLGMLCAQFGFGFTLSWRSG